MVTLLLVSIAMIISLAQFQETPTVEWVKLAEQISGEFKAKNVSVRVNLNMPPGLLKVSYLAGLDSNYDLAVQNAEMEKVARFAAANYKGKDQKYIGEVRVNRTEIHGSGCFQQSYVADFKYPIPRRQNRFPGATELPPGDLAPGEPPGSSAFPPRDR
jgi:hypothetical protein